MVKFIHTKKTTLKLLKTGDEDAPNPEASFVIKGSMIVNDDEIRFSPNVKYEFRKDRYEQTKFSVLSAAPRSKNEFN